MSFSEFEKLGGGAPVEVNGKPIPLSTSTVESALPQTSPTNSSPSYSVWLLITGIIFLIIVIGFLIYLMSKYLKVILVSLLVVTPVFTVIALAVNLGVWTTIGIIILTLLMLYLLVIVLAFVFVR